MQELIGADRISAQFKGAQHPHRVVNEKRIVGAQPEGDFVPHHPPELTVPDDRAVT